MRVSAVLALVVWLTACGQTGSAGESPEPPRPFTYEETTAGLQDLMEDIMEAGVAGDSVQADILARTLELEAPQMWFRQAFGEELGDELFGEYVPVRGRLVQLGDLLVLLHSKGQSRIKVERFDAPEDEAATGYQALALQRMVARTPLYSVRVTDSGGRKVFHIWSFVYQDGWFRWIGKTRKLAKEPVEGSVDVREFRVRDMGKAREAMP